MISRFSKFYLLSVVALLGLQVQAQDILSTSGFASCSSSDSDIVVNNFDVQYDRKNMTVKFNVAGESKKEQEVVADLVVTAYGKEVYRESFDPCEKKISLLCPVPAGNFSAAGNLPIPDEFADQIPSIAFTIPDLDGLARLELRSKSGNSTSSGDGNTLACLQSTVRNGKTAEQPAVVWVTAGIAGAAAVLGSVSLIASAAGLGGGSGGSSGPSPSFFDVCLWFQFISTNGMMSVNYPPVYRAFTKNFGWSTGLIEWADMQRTIDNFRGSTGGNITKSSYSLLKNTTLIYTSDVSSSNIGKRSVNLFDSLFRRQVELGVNGTTIGNSSVADEPASEPGNIKSVHGIEAYVETLSIPDTNTFMTVLLIFCIVLAATAVLILLFKLILELYALCGKLNKPLASFRKRYWSFLLGTLVRIILLMYGIWVIYCLYQFKQGDSWAANLLAGVTLAVFTGILIFFAVRITILARRAKRMDGTAQALEDKKNLRKYGLFYDQYKTTFWWMFIPFIIYLFAKGAIIALGSGNGLVQSSGQLACEIILFAFLVIGRPFNSKSGNVINIFIAVVRIVSVACILIFTEQLRMAQTTTTITGVVLIVVQSVLTGLLAILIAVNAIIICCRQNYYTKRRHDREKLAEDAKLRDTLTPLDPRNSIIDPSSYGRQYSDGKGRYQPTPTRDDFALEEYPAPRPYPAPPHDRDGSPVPHPAPFAQSRTYSSDSHQRSFSGERMEYPNGSRQSLIGSAAPMSHAPGNNRFPPTSYDDFRNNQRW